MCFDCGLTYFLCDWTNLYDLKFQLLKIFHFVYSSIFGNDKSKKVLKFLPNFLVTSAFVHSKVNYCILEVEEHVGFKMASTITTFDINRLNCMNQISSLFTWKVFGPRNSTEKLSVVKFSEIC